MKRWMVFLPLVVLVAICGVSLWQLMSKNPAPTGFASPTRAAPTRQMPGFDQPAFSLAEYKGRPVLVNFWGSYCAPCKLEHPLLLQMQKAGVEIVGVLYHDPNPDAARAYLASHGDPFARIAVDEEGAAFVDFGAAGVPESFLVDAKGVIVKSQRSYFDADSATAFIDAYKAEQARSPAAAPTPAG